MVTRHDSTLEVNPEHDYLRRQIKNLIEFAARLLARARDAARADETLAELREAAAFALGARIEALEHLSPAAAAKALGNPERLRGYAAIAAAEAELLFRARRGPESARQAAHAAALYREFLRAVPDDPDARAALDAVTDLLPLPHTGG